ncbi:porin [Gramella sp. AN32]|uniref:Porin n=1 Tax=Christiangramia antarctica TaxID=2058158 RepID=A0ABW5WYQ8_9FLAO|nr:porin [Gramella sp. AN32]MCM4155106.1 porin [Gramella sp. AN32]
MRRILVTLLVCFIANTFYAQELGDSKFGKGILNYTTKDSSFSVKFAPRIQFRSISNWDYNGEKFEDINQSFLIRRARLKFDGFAYSPKLHYKIELGIANRDIAGANQFNRNSPRIILDAFITWNFHENFLLLAGQAKLPGNIERVISSANLQLTDRSILNASFNLDRDVGLQLHHFDQLGDTFIMREKIAISQGEGRNVTEGNLGGLEYTGRVEFLPLGAFENDAEYVESDLERQEDPKLMLGVTYDYNDDAVKTRSNLGSYMFLDNGELYMTNITTVFVDAMFKYQGFSMFAEYADRNADAPVALIQGETDNTSGDIVLTGKAFNVQAGYLFQNNWEIAGRFTSNDYEEISEKLDEKMYTIGVNKYIVGHKLKIQSDINYATKNGVANNIYWTSGFELHF